MSAADWSKPREVSGIQCAFPASLADLLPAWEELPEPVRQGWHRSPWSKQAETWFYWGADLKKSTVKPREGIDVAVAFRHLGVCLGSFEPKHEHKIAGVGYLMSLWFEELDLAPRKQPGGAS